MTYYRSDLPDQRQHHYLFHIFRMDKAENPMPESRAETLLKCLRTVFENKRNNRKQGNQIWKENY